MALKKVHLIAGLFFILVFLATGQYMDLVHNHLQGMEPGKRMLFRSGHIYILLAAVTNILYGYNYSQTNDKRLRILQGLISVVLLSSLVLLTVGFFYEPHMENLLRPFSNVSLHLLFGLGIIVGIVGLYRKSGSDKI